MEEASSIHREQRVHCSTQKREQICIPLPTYTGSQMCETYNTITEDMMSTYHMEAILSMAKNTQRSMMDDDECFVLYNIETKELSMTNVNTQLTSDDIPLYVFGKYSDLADITEEAIKQNIKLHFIL